MSGCLLLAGISNQRTKVGFAEQRHKEAIQERVGLQMADRKGVKPAGVVAKADRGEKSVSGAETAAARLRAQRSLSPEGHRSSSLPPPAHRNIPPTTPSMCLSCNHHPLSRIECSSTVF